MVLLGVSDLARFFQLPLKIIICSKCFLVIIFCNLKVTYLPSDAKEERKHLARFLGENEQIPIKAYKIKKLLALRSKI